MPKVLVTGGTGFVGYWMFQTQPPGLDCKYIGKRDYWLWYWHVLKWDYIVHLAPVSPLKALGSIRESGGRLLFASSGAVYEQQNEYADNKRAWERLCVESGLDTVIARLFTFFGEKLDGGKAIVQFVRAARAGQSLRIWGDGNTVRSYMSGQEMGTWLWAILLKGERGQAYDVGSDKPVTMLELARMVAGNYDPRPQIVIENGVDKVPYYMPKDTGKTRRLLK